jgi:hypothetical protein
MEVSSAIETFVHCHRPNNPSDHGPNKFSTTDNCLFYFGSAFNIPMYTLWQRDRFDAAEPWSMFWYDPGVSGAWWDGLALDKLFDDDQSRWGSMRTSWTDNDGMYAAMKASALINHQTHGTCLHSLLTSN